jgi:hypothetical protein
METIQSQGLSRTEYIRYVYGDRAKQIADAFYSNGIATVVNPYRLFTISISTEAALWVYLDSMYSMKPQHYNYYSVS